MVTRSRLWIWSLLFALLVALVVTLGTSWNLTLVTLAERVQKEARLPWAHLVWGTLGFLTTLGMVILFFVRLAREMKINQLQSEFLARVSHELKTPIASIELTSGLLRAGPRNPDEATRLWAVHAEELERLKKEVLTLLEAARWDVRPPAARPQRIDLEEWLADSLPRWRRVLGNDATLERTGAPLQLEALVDPQLLDLISTNIIDNARKFAKDRPALRIRTEIQDGSRSHWLIHFEDQGWGFLPQERKRIFRRFFRSKGHRAIPHAVPGTGLGLSLAQTASRHSRLQLRGSSPGIGRGATFTLQGRIAESER